MTSVTETETAADAYTPRTDSTDPLQPNSQWMLGRGLRWAWRSFRAHWAALPEAAWKQWIITLTIGWIAAGALAFALAFGAQRLAAAGYFTWDEAVLRWIADAAPYNFKTAMYFGVLGDSLFLFALVPAASLITLARGYPLRSLTILATLFLTDVVVFVGWQTWDRVRPDILYNGIAAPPLHSFPSGHTVQAIVVFGFLVYLWIHATRHWTERLFASSLYLLVIANVILTRLELGTHWPSDIVGALPLGIVWLASLIIADRRAEAVKRTHQRGDHEQQ